MSDERNPQRDPQNLDAIQAALESWDVPVASEHFRAQLREEFLALSADSSTNRAALPAAETTADQLDGWQVPAARPAFRAQLREEFLASAATMSTSAPAGSLRLLPRIALTLTAAAAAVLLFITFNRPAEATWQTVDFAQGASFQLDGEDVAQGQDEGVRRALDGGGCQLTTGDENLALLHVGEGVLLEFPAQTELRLVPQPRGEEGLIEVELIHGGLRIATTEEFQGRVLVHTPDTTIALSGHVLGIDVLPEGTCLCIVGGSASIQPLGDAGEEAFTVGDMSTTFVTRAGEVKHLPAGRVHHAEEMDQFFELRKKYLF